MTVGGVNLITSFSTTPDAQSKGLAIRDSLNENEGMLFIFETPQKYSFWMKDMKFPIDIIWINQDGKYCSHRKKIFLHVSSCFRVRPIHQMTIHCMY